MLDHCPRGRPRDLTRDPQILESTLHLLATVGYERLTVDAVAAHARAGKATIYRRWPSKDRLVIDALSCLGAPQPKDVDTGSLRADLLAVFGDVFVDQGDRKLKVMTGMLSALRANPELRLAFERDFIGPRQQALTEVFARAKQRGEVGPDADLELLVVLAPAVLVHRLLFTTQPVDRAFVERVIDHAVLPLAGGTPTRRRSLRRTS